MYHDERHTLAVHRSLLQDAVRTKAYADAIARAVHPGDVVLDLGTGSGVLAILACRAGARRVFAIEQGHMADMAAIVMSINDCGGRIELIHKRSFDVELPERASVLVTETLGNLGFDEQILPSVIDARKRLLTAGARLIPSRLALIAAPVETAELYDREVDSWSQPFCGIDFSPLRIFSANQVRIVDLEQRALLASAAQVLEVDLATAESAAISGAASFTVARDGVLHGFGVWFAAALGNDIRLSNEPPLRTPTWRQALLPLEQPAAVSRGSEVTLEIDSADGLNWRWKGVIDGRPFDQTTLLGFPPCRAPSS
jgi:protein arginine N-methyltransferase 1